MKPYIVTPPMWGTILTALITVTLLTLKVFGVLSTLPWLLVFWPVLIVIFFCSAMSVATYISVRMEVEMSMFAQWWRNNHV